jgi:hypothetical protein
MPGRRRRRRHHKRKQGFESIAVMTWENYLKAIYYDPSKAGSFSGPDKLYRYV